MNKGIIAGIVGVAVVAVGIGIFVASQNAKQPAAEQTTPITSDQSSTPSTSTDTTTPETPVTSNPEVVNVSYTDNGFEPASLSVTKGQKVTFTNNSTRGMRVASNPHPGHTNYPEFVQGATVGGGGTYSFTFDKVGTWGYHNHIFPDSVGTITVAE